MKDGQREDRDALIAQITEQARIELEERFEARTFELMETNRRLETEAGRRLLAERELRQSQRSLGEAQRLAHMGSLDWDIVAGTFAWSDETFRIFGHEPQSFEPGFERYFETVHPDDLGFVKQSINAAMDHKGGFAFDYRVCRPDGEVRFVQERGEVLVDAGGVPVRVIGSLQDITRQRESELALLRSYELQRAQGEVLRLAQDELDLDDFMSQALAIVAHLPDLVHDGRVALFLSEADAQDLRLAARVGFSEAQAAGCQRVVVGHCLCGRVARDGATLFALDTDERHEIVAPDMPAHAHYVIPMKRRDQLIGVLCIHAPPDHEPVRRETEALTSLADTLAAAIERKRADAEMRKLSTAVERSSDWTIITDADGCISYVNEAVVCISGYSREELIGANTRVLKSARQDETFHADLWATIRSGQVWRSVVENRRRDGGRFLIDMTITPLVDGSGVVTNFVSTGKDITAQAKVEARLQHLAYYDSVTDLVNRRLFLEKLRQETSRSERHGRRVAVVVADVDRFKMLNDTLGHEGGDQVLKELGTRLQAVTREGDIVARLGTDEFGVALSDVAELRDVARIVSESLRRVTHAPLHVGDRDVVTSFATGVAVFPDDGASADEILEHAYSALAKAKKLGGNNLQFYEPAMNAHTAEFVNTQRRLADAITEDEFVLHYQPYMDVWGGGLAGMEALIRWQPGGGDLIPPGVFIPVLEETGMMHEVEEWILGAICDQITRWQAAGHRVVPVSMNVSPIRFRKKGVLERMTRTIEERGIAPTQLTLEITESMFMDDIRYARTTLAGLKEAGFTISIDDFGTGFSSLSYLAQLPVDNLKIDMSFVRNLQTDPRAESIVKAIIQMARGIGLKTIAEGVENGEQLAILRGMDCDFVQGYFFSRPQPPEVIEADFLS